MDMTALLPLSGGTEIGAIQAIPGFSASSISKINEVLTKSQELQGQSSDKDMFAAVLQTAIDNLGQTNDLLSAAENEEIKWALGESENTHQLAIALQKASTALQYTVAVRDRFMEAYKEIMQMQI